MSSSSIDELKAKIADLEAVQARVKAEVDKETANALTIEIGGLSTEIGSLNSRLDRLDAEAKASFPHIFHTLYMASASHKVIGQE